MQHWRGSKTIRGKHLTPMRTQEFIPSGGMQMAIRLRWHMACFVTPMGSLSCPECRPLFLVGRSHCNGKC